MFQYFVLQKIGELFFQPQTKPPLVSSSASTSHQPCPDTLLDAHDVYDADDHDAGGDCDNHDDR